MGKPCTRLVPSRLLLQAVAVAVLLAASSGSAQTVSGPDTGATLKAQIERAWTVVRLEDGVLLVPRRAGSAIGGVEIKGSRIAVDGNAVSREALRERFGADVDPVLALVDLTEAERLAALGLAEHESVPGVDQNVGVHEWPAARTRHTGARVRIGGDVNVPEGENAGEAAVAILGSVTVNGEVNGDAVAVLGNVRLGPSAIVRGNAVAVGGRLERAEGAQVFGEVTEVSIGFPGITVGLPDVAPVHVDFQPGRWLAGVAFAGTTVRMLVFAVVAFLALLLAPGAVQRVQQQVREAPLRAGTIGLITLVLLVPALLALCLVLVVSIIGIPLLALMPVLLLAGFLAWSVGVAAVATTLGARVLGASDQPTSPRFGALALGLALVWGLTVVARLAWWTSGDLSWPVVSLGVLGTGVELVVAAVALGALLLAWSERRAVVPPMPPAPTVV